MTDAGLVAAALEGSEDAYRELVERHQRGVFGLVVRMVRDRGVAEDLTQEAFVKAFGALASFDRKRKFSSWLLKIAHNTTIDFVRKRKLATVPLETAGEDAGDVLAVVASTDREGPADQFESGELGRALERAIGHLRDEYRAIVLLRYSEGLPYEDIAVALSVPLGTVKTQLHRARKLLMAELVEAGWHAKSRRP